MAEDKATTSTVPSTPATTPTPSTKDDDGKNKSSSPYTNVVSKKLRALRKKQGRLQEIEKKFNDNPSVLDEDQLKALERKGEVENNILLLENILEELQKVEKEETKGQETIKKKDELDQKGVIAEAVRNVETVYGESMLRFVKFLRLLHYETVGIVRIPEKVHEAVDSFRETLINIVNTNLEESSSDKARRVFAQIGTLDEKESLGHLVNDPPINSDEIVEQSNDAVTADVNLEDVTGQTQTLTETPEFVEVKENVVAGESVGISNEPNESESLNQVEGEGWGKVESWDEMVSAENPVFNQSNGTENRWEQTSGTENPTPPPNFQQTQEYNQSGYDTFQQRNDGIQRTSSFKKKAPRRRTNQNVSQQGGQPIPNRNSEFWQEHHNRRPSNKYYGRQNSSEY